jgi:hypothetical protein
MRLRLGGLAEIQQSVVGLSDAFELFFRRFDFGDWGTDQPVGVVHHCESPVRFLDLVQRGVPGQTELLQPSLAVLSLGRSCVVLVGNCQEVRQSSEGTEEVRACCDESGVARGLGSSRESVPTLVRAGVGDPGVNIDLAVASHGQENHIGRTRIERGRQRHLLEHQ